MLKRLFLLLTCALASNTTYAANNNACLPPQIELSLTHFSYCLSQSQVDKISFNTFANGSYSILINGEQEKLRLSLMSSSSALAGLPKKYDLQPLTFLNQLLNENVDIHSNDREKLHRVFGLIDEANLFTASNKGNHVFSSIRASGNQTAYILTADSRWLLKVEGQFEIGELMSQVNRLQFNPPPR